MSNWIMVGHCPHCGAEKVAFTGLLLAPVPGREQFARHAFGQCNNCHGPLTAVLESANQGNHWHSGMERGDLLNNHLIAVEALYPPPQPVEVPVALPEGVARSFREAAESRKRGLFSAACAMYRRAMEQGLKVFSPDVEAFKLERRIDKLAAEHRITPELQSWAHSLRLDGNEALHGDAEATQELADQMHHLCWFLLVYLYTMPNQVQQAKERRGSV